ncbi:MAG TPA: UDP-N-acetylmuramate--L-alanine ligase, partial [Thermoanaerobaculia bacterium]|nr:UDP-N-acetylmuramate--L-alanine ligase [Thermoanaerobaculia bacterium]
DKVLVLDVYSAGEDNPTGVQASDLANLLPNGSYVGDFEGAREVLQGLVGRDDILLLMGAGDIRKLGDELAQRV